MSDTSKLQVQMLKDGKRTVIVISGAEPEQDELAYQLITTYFSSALTCASCSPAPVQPVPAQQLSEVAATPEVMVVEDLEAVEDSISIPSEEAFSMMEDYSIARSRNKYVISAGEYCGITALDALHRDQEVALARLHKYATGMKDSAERDEIIVTCKQYMRDLPMTTKEYLTRERKCEFIRNIASMTTVVPFINGYVDVRSFIDTASDAEVSAAIEALAYALGKRGGL